MRIPTGIHKGRIDTVKPSRFYIYAVIVLVGVLAFWLGRQRGPSPASKPPVSANGSQERDESRVEAMMARIEQRLELLEMKQAAPVTAAPRATAKDDPPMSPEPEEIRERDAKRAEELRNKLATEPRDRPWATGMEDQLRRAAQAAAHDGGAYSISGLACQTTVCRLELSVSNSSDPRARGGTMLPFLVKGIAGFHTEQPVKNADGSTALVYEFFREGYPMPGG